ncbi:MULTISPECIES: hypothetical protein [unclassified Pseudomonas]|uniref:hypothetical protein n=1 Tax=unclassified Pseudomonas TaxID=196821 RepID=UPI000C884FA6|nr:MULTISPECIES: hypothetical protein [unclassified Pseudomonas]PMZ95635.1 hypothetical protein C1X79_13665 [Pseudomonas sp. FW305-42]PNA24070.1 hypothetical protein C1X78_12445 [Pseudomonas sp. MPR-R1B]PNB24724.1 hypothetical protein C1X80_16480 [Pseudomonas sp. DP16D-E2]PNB42143.1 hypothetical protein C1X75_17270 [Pseudomonas sp. FW305-17]PNB58781.1 hypothetical protein C1X77_17550 [Pseudomonas sp. GW531-E2]
MTTPAVASKEAARTAKLAHATDDFIAEHLPAWLKGAGASAINRLRDSARAHRATQTHLATAFEKIEPLDLFVARKLPSEVIAPLELTQNLKHLYWREGHGTLHRPQNPLDFPRIELQTVQEPLQQRMLRNFEANASFFEGTGLPPAEGESVRLGLARRLFRPERVEHQARLHMQRLAARYARNVPNGAGLAVDEVEVSLA